MAETFDWIKPSLLWQSDSQDMLRPEFFRPALLEFRSDDFVKDFLTLAGSKRADGLRNVVAKPLKAGRQLKFFQPAHGNFYLTCASLCCRMPGFPDREVQKGEGESAFFVLRKKVNGREYGWVPGENDSGWRPLNGSPILKDEERLPLFPVLTGQNRNLFYGYVPVSSQQTYAAAQDESPVDTADARVDELEAKFIDPIAFAGQFGTGPTDQTDLFGTAFILPNAATELRISVFLLLDLFEYFEKYLPELARALVGDLSGNPNAEESDLLSFLRGQSLRGTLNLAQAIGNVVLKRSDLDQAGDSDLTQPPFNFVLANYTLKGVTLNTSSLKTKVQAALASRPETKPSPVKVPKLGQKAEDLYVLRYVYERAQCDPAHRYVSQPTEPFELAPFFDPDAPGRPIRIGLPVDVSLAGLRKFPRNVAFMMSNELRNKMSAVNKGMLKGDSPGADGSFNIGHICSFSIPIITLIAFILLMIIAILLNIVFWWLPLLKICFPLKLSAKT